MLAGAGGARHVYRSRSQLITAIFFAVFSNLIAVDIAYGGSRDFPIALLVLVPLNTAVFGRLALTKIVASSTGVHVVNFFSSRDVKWGKIEKFDIGRSELLPMVCRIHIRDGTMLHAVGVQETNLRTGAAKQLIEAMNEELAERRASGNTEFSVS